MAVERPEPALVAGERETLTSFLDYQRATLAWKCDGVPPERLPERGVPPSSMSLLGIVRHMADVERSWFRRVLAGEDAPPVFWSKENQDGDFDDVDTADPDEAFAIWQAECERAREITAGMELDHVVVHPRWGEELCLRWVLVHMIEEYARHNGHADLLRERIDGAVGE
jgi:hypothetical protein